MNAVFIILTVVLEVFTVIVQRILVEKALNSRERKKHCEIIAWIVYMIVFNSVTYRIKGNVLINIGTFFISFFLLLTFLYRDALRYRFFVTTFLYLSGMCSELIAYHGLRVTGIYRDIQYVEPGFFIMMAIISKLIWFFLIKILLLFVRKNKMELGIQDWLEAVFVPVGSILTLITCFPLEKLILMEGNKKIPLEILGIIILMVINIVTYYLYEKGKLAAEKRIRERVLQEQCNYYMHQCAEAQQLWLEFGKFRHDMKQKYIYLNSLLEAENYDELKRYCKKNLEFFTTRKSISTSGNIYFDSIINYKAEMAGKDCIKFSLNMEVPHDCHVNGEEISVCLGNLLDNAIEATKETEKGKREVIIIIKIEGHNLYISVRNPYVTPRVKKGGEYLTTKQKRTEHGFGLRIVKEIAEKYNGEVVIRDENNMFSVTVLLYGIVE
ncbi:MAG: GHKL domain-containing protein [Lachnospiraceae bacterium]|nr:GHKL domain-containing protein [Lachnospiraceae bacterium]